MKKIKKNLKNFYKKIIQVFFKFLYGDIKGKTSHFDSKDIVLIEVEIDKNNYKIYNCKECSLYTDTIHNTAIINKGKIVNGPSFQLRNNINVDCMNNSVISKGTPRFKKKIKGKVVSLLTGGGGNSNYWHWMFDVLPRLNIIKNKEFVFNYYLFPDLSQKFQNETLDLLQISEKKRLSSRSFRHFDADEIVVTSHPYNILNDPTKDSLDIPSWIYDYLRINFLEKGLKNTKLKSFPKKIYINRRDATSLRYIINLKEVEDILEKENFSSITLSNYSFSDQIALFNNADKIIGLHGAGFANLIFCKPGTKVIELKPNTAGDIIKNLAIKNNLIYDDISCETKTIKLNNQEGDVYVEPKILKNKI